MNTLLETSTQSLTCLQNTLLFNQCWLRIYTLWSVGNFKTIN